MKAKKKYGQNFLNSKEILDKIIETVDLKKEDIVMEIGPGSGILTAELLKHSKKVIAIEIDRDLEKVLCKKNGENPKFDLIMDDFLNIDLEKLIEMKNLEKIKIVANIPYYITAPIIQKLIKARKHIDSIYLMVQKEVGQRINGKINSSDRSTLTLSVEYFANASYCFDVKKENFRPVPKIDSGFIKIDINDFNQEREDLEKDFFKIVKAGFQFKRKKLINNLSKNLNLEKDKLEIFFKENNFDLNLRAQNLNVNDFIKIAKYVRMTNGM